ncbi:MAG TPA: hypothetical protein VGM53_14095 [Streptosporangiaceae bacterium]
MRHNLIPQKYVAAASRLPSGVTASGPAPSALLEIDMTGSLDGSRHSHSVLPWYSPALPATRTSSCVMARAVISSANPVR